MGWGEEHHGFGEWGIVGYKMADMEQGVVG